MLISKHSLLYKNPSFRTFFVADTFGKIADSYFLLLLPFLLKDLTQTGFALGLALATNAITRGMVSFFGGVLADRYEPQRILAWHNFAQMLTLVFLCFVLIAEQESTVIVFIISALFGTLDGFASPASTSAAAKIVDRKELLEANSYIQGLEQLTAIIGPVAAGLITAKFGMLNGIIGGVVLYGLSTLFFGLIYKKNLVKKANFIAQIMPLKQIKQGLQIARDNSIVKMSILLMLLNNLFITGPAVIGLVLLYERRFNLGSDVYAYSGVLFSIGFVLGITLVKKLIQRFAPSKILLYIYILYGVCLVGIGLAPNVWWVMLAYFLVGPGVAVDSAITTTWVQTSVSKKFLGRIGSLAAIVSLALDPLSQALTGWGSDWSILGVFCVSGVGITTGFLFLYVTNPVLRNISLPAQN